jgi:ubiquinone/menaquinone biosynthesis C-methylase UbiE
LTTKSEKVGLYALIDKAKNGDLTSQDILEAIKPEMPKEVQERLLIWAKEFKFWEEYAKIYHHMEDTGFYEELARTIFEFIEPKEGGVWLDAGCGPAKMSKLILEKSRGKIKKIIAVDIVLEPARKTLKELSDAVPIELQYVNLGEKLPFPDNFFDGIVANLCLTYVIDFEGKRGKEAFIEVMKEMFRILKPGGCIVWSTPKRNPIFLMNFLAGLPDMLSPIKQIKHRTFGLWMGIRILRYGLGIASKGKKGIYTFLEPTEYEEILTKIGFRNFEWRRTFAGQVWVNKAFKPTLSIP